MDDLHTKEGAPAAAFGDGGVFDGAEDTKPPVPSPSAALPPAESAVAPSAGAASEPPLHPPQEIRKRRRLDTGLEFSSPGRAFQPAGDTEAPPVKKERARHSARTPRPSRAALESDAYPRVPRARAETSPIPPNAHGRLDRCRALEKELVRKDMDVAHREHDMLVRELFHLTKFVTLTSYDPEQAKTDDSEVFRQFQAHYDLASKLLEKSHGSTRTTRRSANAHRQSLGLGADTPRRAENVREAPEDGPSKKPAPENRRTGERDARIGLVPLCSAKLNPAKPPRPPVMAPQHRPLPPLTPGGSLAALFASYAMWDDDVVTPQVRAQRIAREQQLYLRLDQYRRQGKMLEPSTTPSLHKLKPHEAPRTKAHHDHMLDGVVFRARQMHQSARGRIQLAKKVARMVTAYWEREQNSGEREHKLEVRRQRALAKWTMREVARQWKLAVTVVRGQKQAVERAEREKLGKKQLQAILEQSTQMLKTQHHDLTLPLSEDEDEEDEDEEAEEDDDDTDVSTRSSSPKISMETEDKALEDQMWKDDVEDDSEEDDLVADAELSIEELRKKYGYPGQDTQDTHAAEATDADGSASDGDVSERSVASSEAADDSDDAASAPAQPTTFLETLAGQDDQEGALPLVRVPFLLRGTLRPYQQKGLEWLVSLHNNKVNGILADEMGLGKTIQTIALLAHLACDRGIWGPHLVIAPTSVMLNWEMEFKKFLPGFKVLSYYGTQKQRKAKRVGWNTENSFNVCITSYQLVLADQHIFRRKPWMYMVLDEAHHIKNFRSQRWQTLLGFNTQHRLLLTGTPLQNNLMDLWSLLYFLMPQGIEQFAAASGAFTNMKDFQEWFSNPLGRAAEGGEGMDEETRETVSKLHTVLRPYVLRRLKADVEREMPKKYEHVLPCRLSKRQRFLYNDFMSRAKTRESLASGNYMSIINCLMQLRKVCNHPDLFEPRPTVTAFVQSRSVAADYEINELLVRRRLLREKDEGVNLDVLNLQFTQREAHLTPLATRRYRTLQASDEVASVPPPAPVPPLSVTNAEELRAALQQRRANEAYEHAQHIAYLNRLRCDVQPVYGCGIVRIAQALCAPPLISTDLCASETSTYWTRSDALSAAVLSYQRRSDAMAETLKRYAFATPAAVAADMPRAVLPGLDLDRAPVLRSPALDPLHRAAVQLNVSFPDASLLQYDSGKLQQLDTLMRRLVPNGHRVLIFTQMTKVLDLLEKFFNYQGYRYLRLDGATKVEQRQVLTERFNRDTRISAFILSTRSGGLGINLVGADTVIFYDLDWNAAIEAQCMDRAHRIGQTRDVHIYRFVSEHTIEENMLRKANQKRRLDSMVIQQGEFTTEHIVRNDWRDMLDENGTSLGGVRVGEEAAHSTEGDVHRALFAAEDAEDAAAGHVAEEEMQLDQADFAAEGVPVGEGDTSVVADAETSAVQDEQDPVGSIDDYMLHVVETEWAYFGA